MDIDKYLNKIDEPQHSELQRIRNLIKKIVPEAEEVITYAMPGFRYKGKYLISYAAFKDHLSIFPGSEAIETLNGDLKEFKTSKGTIQFTVDKPISDILITKIIKIRKQSINS